MAMTSANRSRRADVVHPHTGHHPHLTIANARAQTKQDNFVANSPRPKRRLEAVESEVEPAIPKKARFTTRITVEISSRPAAAFRTRAAAAPDAKPQAPTTKPGPSPSNPPNPSRPPPTTATRDTKVATTGSQKSQGLTKHKEKVVNGLKHELSRLQPLEPVPKEEGRKLRSQEATRFKSDLSQYLPDYDEVIGNDPKEQHLLDLNTPIIVTGSDPQAPQLPGDAYPVRSYGDSLFTDLCDAQTVNFDFLKTRDKGKSLEDPLPDSFFEPAHKKAQRLERSIRNSEKGYAQHEKEIISRLLDGLQGPEWLRTMGVNGVTESRKKTFEPAREHFIAGCQAILEKFRRWAAEEKRRKLEKERAPPVPEVEETREESEAEVDDVEIEPSDVDEIADSDEENQTSEAEEGVNDDDQDDGESDGDPPDESDVDASIAKQLREEAARAAARKTTKKSKSALSPPPPPEPQKEFTSFFRKKYQRDAALSSTRRRGRTVLAWGQPVPELPEMDFELPEEFLDEDTLKSHARRKRRAKREKH
ncbi:something about silencing, SAS, complex subunit 4-domain-containing protein [Diplogelasinospora grovesii]|uniref:Something about silencing, SAS, complex subunit 4-domain-containing protein n=1 Tax=Diplogelasinospora grovesii TaxID=303347 RepID=A0AAN6N9Y0_9PEZI|nr:something about silencing, SAS, complex subunit 4-domain-containing protein [Diplogelasinospora grovesii]